MKKPNKITSLGFNRKLILMSIKDWPSDERPREKLLQHGASSLSDAELLAIFIRTGLRGKTAVELARDLLNTFGGLRSLLTAPQAQLCAMRGLGTAKYVQLQATLEIARRHYSETLRRDNAFSNPQAARTFLVSRLRDYPKEVFACMFLDNRHRLIRFDELFHGTIDAAAIYPREVVKAALACNAAAVIFAHNHPSGVAEPSKADEQITHRLKNALALVDIRVLDHLVIGDGDIVSFAERSLL